MALQSQLTLSGTATRLSDIYGDGAGVVNAMHDIPYTQVYLQASGADAYLGVANVSTTIFGLKLKMDETQNLSGGMRNIKLSEFYVLGAGATLHILGVQF